MLRFFLLLVAFAGVTIRAGNAETKQLLPPHDRIVGGSDADIREYPHQISMRYNGRHRCGGSIYSPNIIVSASHCVVNVIVSRMSIVAGSTLLSENNIEIPVLKIIMHEKYDASTQDYDVSMLVLRGLLPFNSYIQPIALAKERPSKGTPVTVTGWGTLERGGSSPDHLQKVTVNVVDNTDCNNSYLLMDISDRMICANVEGGGKDSCQGDSGGPLVVGNTLLGIVSFGRGCARKRFPGVYASVPNLYEWIETHAKANSLEFA